MTDARPDTWTILVVRSGGFAGLTREWRVSSTDHPEVDWVGLVEACPWNTATAPDHARDQFVWRIEAKDTAKLRRATVPDSNLRGAWRNLVEEVKAVNGAPRKQE